MHMQTRPRLPGEQYMMFCDCAPSGSVTCFFTGLTAVAVATMSVFPGCFKAGCGTPVKVEVADADHGAMETLHL
jgi:hypothetical protein